MLWFAVIPACGRSRCGFRRQVQEPPHVNASPAPASEIGALGAAYWLVVVAGAIFTLARFSEAFLVIRAMDGGLALAWAPAVIAVMSLVFAASAYPAGRLQDRIGARPLLLLGLCALVAADLVLAAGSSLLAIFIGIGLWGLHLGLTQGVLATLIAATARERLAGTPSGCCGPHHRGLRGALVASGWRASCGTGSGPGHLSGRRRLAATALIAFLLVQARPWRRCKLGPAPLYSCQRQAALQASAIHFRR